MTEINNENADMKTYFLLLESAILVTPAQSKPISSDG